ncbi:MAG: tetratricopeptide repeat protein [Candidatus Omnitrophota bacterium]
MKMNFCRFNISVLLLLAVGGYPFIAQAERLTAKAELALEGEISSISREFLEIKQIVDKKGGASIKKGRLFSNDSPEASFDYKTALQDIEKQVKQKDYRKAGELCDLLLRNYSGNRQAHYLRALLNQRTGELEKAIDDYQFLIEHKLADAKVYNNLASIYAQKEDFTKAKDLYNQAIKENYSMAEAHNNLADLYLRENAYDQAMAEYEKVIAFEPKNARAFYNLGVVYMKKGDLAQAQEQWKKVLLLDPADADARGALENLEKLLKPKQKEGDGA